MCSLRLAVRTTPFHGVNTGSIPVGNAMYGEYDWIMQY